MEDNAGADFEAGLELLTPFFEERDFALRVYSPVVDDEGTHRIARFVWGNHLVTLRHDRGLAAVTYSIGSMSMEHEAYIDALGVGLGSSFSASKEDSSAAYQALLSDLETYLAPFFECPDREFFELAESHGRSGVPPVPSS